MCDSTWPLRRVDQYAPRCFRNSCLATGSAAAGIHRQEPDAQNRGDAKDAAKTTHTSPFSLNCTFDVALSVHIVYCIERNVNEQRP